MELRRKCDRNTYNDEILIGEYRSNKSRRKLTEFQCCQSQDAMYQTLPKAHFPLSGLMRLKICNINIPNYNSIHRLFEYLCV